MSLSLPALAQQTKDSPLEMTATAFEQLVRQHQRCIYRVIFLVVNNADDADNLTQECFLRAYLSMKTFRGECSIRTWLLRIAVNLARDHVRSRRAGFWKRLLRLEDDGVVSAESEPRSLRPSPERGMVVREELDAVWRAVDQLPVRQKEVFVLRFVEEMDLKEIAEVLKISTGTVKTQLFRAVARVREQAAR
jgi:RNA polymerase sigma-70 factor, ECF subfamily